MPEVLFDVRWPDGSVQHCYSPSTVVTTYFQTGAAYPLVDFVSRSQAAMRAASERVRKIHGMPCSRAAATLRQIEARAKEFAPDSLVAVDLHPADAQKQEARLGQD
jgi:uncharacterized repeat protein (TIGR04042 family)